RAGQHRHLAVAHLHKAAAYGVFQLPDYFYYGKIQKKSTIIWRCNMSRMIEVIYQDNVLKPLMPVKGLKKNERTWIILCSRPQKETLRELAGTLTHKEAEEMQKLIDEEFEKIEGEW
ncbi:MAG: DUF104 domain-containing protein, partial [Peptococcaceae bacterium]